MSVWVRSVQFRVEGKREEGEKKVEKFVVYILYTLLVDQSQIW